jgi:hypothetical protein
MEPQPVAPALELLARARVRVDAPVEIGHGLIGERRVVRLLEGRFDGERLRGDILPGGTDWQVWCADGTAFLEARYVVRTDDGALISIHNRGVRHGPADVLDRIARGEPVDPASYYFRSTPVFETGDERYDWLNRTLAVCSATRTRDVVLLDFYLVT